MKIGVFGGTFNPPHLGHLAAARLAVESLGLDKLLFIPASIPPHKQLSNQTPEAKHRLVMTEIAADSMGLKGLAEVSDLEFERDGKSYTADTLETLHEQFPLDELFLLLGTDMFLTLEHWYRPERIMSLATIVPFARSYSDCEEKLEHQAQYLQKNFDARVRMLRLDEITEISSTQLRSLLVAGKGQEFLPPSVYGYILREKLYGVCADLKHLDIPALRAVSYSMIKAKRIPHIEGTEQAAVKLAQRWGADVALAQRAAILHDCTKYLGLEEQLNLCRKYGILLDALEQRAVKLLHAKTGAGAARYLFGEPDEVYDAIFWHTTGKADMTLLEKIIYLADYMEPTREFDGVEQMRQLAFEDLDRTLLLGFEMSISEMEQRGNPVHPNTVQGRDWLKGTLQ